MVHRRSVSNRSSRLSTHHLRPSLERLELRQLLASDIVESTILRGDFSFVINEQKVDYRENPSQIAVAAKSGATLVLPDTLKWVRAITPAVSVYEWAGTGVNDVFATIPSIAGVDYTTNVFVNPISNSSAVLLNEIIIAFDAGVDAKTFFDNHPEFSDYRSLDGTSDQFIATVKNLYGSDAMRVGVAVQSSPGVAWISPNFYQSWERYYTPNDPRFSNQWHLNNAGQSGGVVDADSDLPEAWNINRGGSASVIISIVDDGIQSNHPDLNVWTNPGEIAGDGIDNDNNGWIDDIHGWNFVLDSNQSEPLGTDKHGTSVSGVAAAIGDNGIGVTGAAYKSRVIAIKIFDGNFVASDGSIASALYYAGGRNRDGSGTWRSGDLVNNSWGGGGVSTAINDALTWGTTSGRRGLGATYLFATGNGFSGTVSEPAAQAAFIPGVVAVGATNNKAERSNYSNFGPEVDIVAPSNDTRGGYLAIDTTDRTGFDGYASGDYTGTGATGFGGTSSATPLATGITALILAQSNIMSVDLNPSQIRDYLHNATDLLPGYETDIVTGKNIEVGFGRINASTALDGIGKAEISVLSTKKEFQSGDSIDLGRINLGRTISTTIRIRNQGTSDLNLSGLNISGPFEIESIFRDSSLAIGESTNITIRFVPTVIGTATGQLSILSDDADESTFNLNLSGLGLPTALSGRFFEDINGDGLRNFGDPTINTVGFGFAYLDLNDDGVFKANEPFAEGDALGYYEFLTIPNGTYTVRYVLPNWTLTAPTAGIFDITIATPDDSNIGRDFGFQKNQRLYARVFDDPNANGIFETVEQPIAGQRVYLDENQNGQYDAGAVTVFNTNPTLIPDLTTITSSLFVSQAFPIQNLQVGIDVNHTFDGDLVISLIGPTGTRVTLVNRRGGGGADFFGTVFEDSAPTPIGSGFAPFTGSFQPETPLSVLDGQFSSGLWQLQVSDNATLDTGTLNAWYLSFLGGVGPSDPSGITDDQGYARIDIPTGVHSATLDLVGAWDYSLPLSGVHSITANPSAPSLDYLFGIFSNNLTPTSLTLVGNSVAENQPRGTFVGSLSSTDLNTRDTFTYSLVDGLGGDDNSLFLINGNELITNASFDFEQQSSRFVRVRTTDTGGLFLDRTFTIDILDVNEVPTNVSLSSVPVPENQAALFLVGNITWQDPDAADQGFNNFKLVNLANFPDNRLFEIRGTQLFTSVTFDYEDRSQFFIRIRALDRNDLFVESSFIVQISDVNEKPTDIFLSAQNLLETNATGVSVGTLTGVDQDFGDTTTFTLAPGTGDADNGKFEIIGNEIKSKFAIDFEIQPIYAIRVRATDRAGLWTEVPFSMIVQNVNERPTSLSLSPNSVNEGLAIGSRVGLLSATDPDRASTFTFDLIANSSYPDNQSFSIEGNELRTAKVLRYVDRTSYTVYVQVTDQGGLTLAFPMVINVINVDESPSDIGLDRSSIAENSPIDSFVGNLSSVDPDGPDTFTYRLITGAPDFRIVGDQLRSNVSVNFEAKSSYSIRVESKDSTGKTIEKDFTIRITNVNEAPTAIGLSAVPIPENSTPGVVGTLSSIDQDAAETFTYSLVSGLGSESNDLFTIVGANLNAKQAFDFEAAPSYKIRIRTTDAGGLSFESPFVISILNVNESPSIQSL
jgi:subtilisin family serine protease/subtilisin-like proprotein convertase family protein